VRPRVIAGAPAGTAHAGVFQERISKHFWMEEFAVSNTKPHLVVPVPEAFKPAVTTLVTTVLEPIRVVIGRAMDIGSAFRSGALNHAVGGSPTSQHVRAQAADWYTLGIEDVFLQLYTRTPKLPHGQLIYYPGRQFIHVATPSPRFPSPTFCVHWPSRQLEYAVVTSLPRLMEMIDR